jgi:hypothetical protein
VFIELKEGTVGKEDSECGSVPTTTESKENSFKFISDEHAVTRETWAAIEENASQK